jgi:hypothetical protein
LKADLRVGDRAELERGGRLGASERELDQCRQLAPAVAAVVADQELLERRTEAGELLDRQLYLGIA